MLTRRSRLIALVIALAVGGRVGLAAADHFGRVAFHGVPVSGATITATQNDQRRVTVTDQDGVYRFTGLSDGVWTLRIEMLGFSTSSQSITIGADAPPPTWELTLLTFEEMARSAPPPRAEAMEPRPTNAETAKPAAPPNSGRPAGAAAAAPPAQAGFQRAQVNASATAATSDPIVSGDANRDQGAADGFLVNGSVNNGASSPFAQLAAFGNNRRNARSLYNGGVGVLLGNSALDARPFSFTTQQTPKPSYDDAQILMSFAGPLKVPRLLRNGPNMFLGYQRTVDHSASTQSGLVPTLLERSGDFSQTRDAAGRLVQLIDPASGQPFAGSVIPRGRLSPQAASLLGYYPLPNLDAGGRFNYQTPVLVTTHQDAAQSRFTQVASGGKNQVSGTLALQRTTTDAGNLFGFVDSSRVSGIDTTVNWSHRFSQFHSLRLRYQFTRLTNSYTPYFANRTNVSGDAGITGNDQDPVNWGAPRLLFSSGVAGLGGAQAAANSNRTNAAGAESLWSHGRHTITFGGDARAQQWSILSQQDARGTFSFSGDTTGSDLADFMLGLPHASSIAFGNADKIFTAPAYDAYVTDDWRASPGLTVNAGVRWEYEAPIAEDRGRLANLDAAPGFTAVRPVVGNNLINPDWRGIQPRVGLALRPVAGSSLVIRAGYGIYRNTSVYQPIALLLAQQPPLSKTLSVESSAAQPLTLANGFPTATDAANTFAIDPDFRVGYAQNWQVLAQRDLPASLTMTATYLGTAGSHLMQEFLPNTVPAGAVNPCPTCPAGFVYLASNGHSHRHTGQLQLRRRLRGGLSAMVQYALSTAMDDAGAFTGVTMSGSAIAQDWQHLDAEWAPSNFDQRHLLTAQVQYTTGAGVSGGGMLDSPGARFLRGWTVTSQLTAGSGLPVTPVYLTSVAGTGVTGTIRANVNAAAAATVPSGYFANPAAYDAPSSGAWGNAGRNSITGPRQFLLDASLGRTFLWGDRLNLDWRLNATNVLNRVTYAAISTVVGGPQFGLPTTANPMRKVQMSLRVRF